MKLATTWTLLFIIILSGCSAAEPITDETTQLILEEVKNKEEYLVYHHKVDNMDRGNHDYYLKPSVIDPDYYKENQISRGDVIFFTNPETELYDNLTESSISRIIALPGENVKILEGQVFINNRRLETFYGRGHRLGSDVKELKEVLEKRNLKDHIRQNVINMVKYIETMEYDEIVVPEGHIYILGDDWFRSVDSRSLGPITIDHVLGKVLGALYEE